MVADVSRDLRREGYLRCEMNENFGNGWARQLEKLERSGAPNAGVCTLISRHLNFKTSSGATLVAVVQPADLGNSDNLACRRRLHRAWLGTILVQGKMCSSLMVILKVAR